MDGRERAALNEENILEIINTQRWVREEELALLADMSLPMTRRTCIRLAKRDEIYRDKTPNGIFLRLKAAGAKRVGGTSGKGVTVPHTWQHDCVAIQGLDYLKNAFKHTIVLTIESEAQVRRRQQAGKIGDGTLQPINYFYQMEYGHKTGKDMHTQAREVALQAKERRGCIIAYPYPPQFCGMRDHEHIDHEYRQTVALRQAWGDAAAPNIRLLRCIMESKLDFLKGRARGFELIELPPMPAKARIDPRRTVDEVMGYRWKHQDIRVGLEHHILSTLINQSAEVCTVDFTESRTEDKPHHADDDGDLYYAREDETFNEFVIRIQNLIVKMQKEMGANSSIS